LDTAQAQLALAKGEEPPRKKQKGANKSERGGK